MDRQSHPEYINELLRNQLVLRKESNELNHVTWQASLPPSKYPAQNIWSTSRWSLLSVPKHVSSSIISTSTSCKIVATFPSPFLPQPAVQHRVSWAGCWLSGGRQAAAASEFDLKFASKFFYIKLRNTYDKFIFSVLTIQISLASVFRS